jgi:probable HAF family extracellular repeat protein
MGAFVAVALLLAAGCGGEGGGSEAWTITDLGPADNVTALGAGGQVVGHVSGPRAVVWEDGTTTVLPAPDEVTEAVAINGFGLIVGNTHPNLNDPDYQAVTWTDGRVEELPTLGGTDSWATAVNDRGQVVGASSTGGPTPLRAVLWEQGRVTDLGVGSLEADTPDGPLTGGPTDVNERGQVVGWRPVADVRSFESYSLTATSFFYDAGRLTTIGKLGDLGCEAAAVNELGQVVGHCWLDKVEWDSHDSAPPNRAFVWQHGAIVDLGTLDGGESWARAVNDLGHVVGNSLVRGDGGTTHTHAVLWRDGAITDLGTLDGRDQSEAVAINERGEVIGSSCLEGGDQCRAFVWRDGTMTDLGVLPGGAESWAVAIDDAGRIAGMGETGNGERHGILWTRLP